MLPPPLPHASERPPTLLIGSSCSYHTLSLLLPCSFLTVPTLSPPQSAPTLTPHPSHNLPRLFPRSPHAVRKGRGEEMGEKERRGWETGDVKRSRENMGGDERKWKERAKKRG
eukprot:2873636-Rhodomonas_salina.2